MNNEVWLAISKISGIGPKTVLKIYLNMPYLTRHEFLEQNKNIDFKSVGVRESSTLLLKNVNYMNEKFQDALIEIENHKKNNIEVVTLSDKRYPVLLKKIKNPPSVLYCKGNIDLLERKKKIAVIGTREPTIKGMNAAGKIASAFSKMDYVIVSGLAIGIDTGAHLGALESQGSTIAVLAGGVDEKSIYPKENLELANRIINNNGLLLSEYAPLTKPKTSNFIQRDRIQSGLCLGVCPVQTDIKGGTQHTINFAFDQKRVVICPVPSEVNHEDMRVYRGIHQLIRENRVSVIKDKNDYDIISGILINRLESLLLNNDLYPENNENIFKIKSKKIEHSQIDIFKLNDMNEDTEKDILRAISLSVSEYIKSCKLNNIDLDKSIKILKEFWHSED